MLRLVEKLKSDSERLPLEDLAASFEQVVAEVLVDRTLRCALDHRIPHIVMVGGVAANARLRRLMQQEAQTNGRTVSIAPLEYCTDNAAMIGVAALQKLSCGHRISSLEIGVSPRWPLERSNALYETAPPF